MKKNVYKKSKKDYKLIKPRKHKNLINTNFSTILLVLILIAFFSAPYYLNLIHIYNNTNTFFIRTYNTLVIHSQFSGLLPLSTNVADTLIKSKHKNPVIAASSPNNPEIGSNQIIWHGSRSLKEVALTFDADMTPIMVSWLQEGMVKTYDDERITDYLAQNHIKATFFLTGLWIQTYPDQTRELAQNPLFELENHTYSHPSMAGYCFDQPQVPSSQFPFEIEQTQNLLQKIAHTKAHFFRFPGGCYNQDDLNLVKKEGLETVHWDVIANDGFNDNVQEIINNVMTQTQNGSIIVMHIGGVPNTPQTASALPVIINGLKKEGYKFVTVQEMLKVHTQISQIDPKRYLTSLETFQYIP